MNAITQVYQCQAYNDHVSGVQIDNVFESHQYYSVFSFTCGNGIVVKCNTGSCKESCRILKGYQASLGYSGAFAIRNVTFIDNYYSPLVANHYGFDFILAFYHGGQMVSAALINAYTIEKARLQTLSAKIYNKYLSTSYYNQGERVPTLLALEGYISTSESKNMSVDEIIVYLPTQINVNKYVEASGRLGCTLYCNSTQYLNFGKAVAENWPVKQSISIVNVRVDKSMRILLPVEITETVTGSIDLAFLNRKRIIGTYRLNGSAIG
jgi:hypothetical protein